MKHFKLFFALFAMLALNMGNAWAEETVVYTLTPAATGSNAAPHNSYTAGADFTCDEITWNITGNSNMVPWRIGGKSLDNAERTLYSKTAMQHKVTKVEVSHGTASSITVNSFKLIVASDANFSNVISTVDGTFKASSTATLECPTEADWSNAYYKFVYKVTVSGSNNKYLQFSEAKFYGTASTTPGDGGETPDPTPSKLSTPANLKEASIAETSATLSWDAVANASNYSVTINGNTETVTTNSYSATGLTAGTAYTWSVVAKGDGTNYTDSDAAQHTFTTASPTPEEPGTGGEETWTLVTNTSDLKAGDEVVITSKDADYALGTNQKTSNREGVAITKNGNTITISNDVQILTLEETGDATVPFALNTGNGYLYAGSSSGNQLKTKMTLDAHGKWAISIADDVASIVATTSTNRNVMQYNYNNGSPLFACYSSASQTALAIYKKVTSSGGDEPGTEEPTDCTPLTPTLSYESTTLLTSTTSSAPTLDGNTGEGTVTYTSSNTEVATVDAETGVITAVNAGTTTITATIAETGEYCEGMATVDIIVKQLVSCADIYNLADDATFVLKDFVVTYVNGKYTYIKDKDDTGYGLIYEDSYGLKAGDQVASGKFEGKRDSYNGLVEIIPTTAAVDLHATNGTAPEPALMTTNPIAGDMNKYVKFENVSFASTAFSSKSINGTIEGKGSSIKFYDQFATNKTFDTSKKYDVIGVVSMFNSVQVNFISAEEVVEPTLNISKSSLDFGKVKNGSTNEQTFTIKGSQLTKDVTLTVEGEHFTVSPETLTPTEGSLNETITVTYNPTAEDDHTATLKVTSNELTEQTVSLQGSAVAEYTVRFYVNKTEETELAKQVLSGDKLDAMPAEPTSCDQLEYPTFIGWSTSEITGTTTEEPTNLLDLNTVITSDCNYYAVFAKSTTTSGGAGSVTMAYNGGTTTNMTEGNNAATVGLDENEWAVIPAKGDANNLPGLNKDNDIRVYGVETGASNTLTITSANQIITDVTITYTSKSYNTGTVSVNGNNVTPSSSSETEATYAINASSFVIGNSTKTQLRIKSVVINYATSTTTYTYLTTCESVTPTYAVTYNLDGGSSTCETSVVVEKDGELTLCDAPTKTGHTFLNWKDQSDDEYEAGATITVSSDLTLTAQWEKESYKVTWMSLGTEVASANVEYNSQPTKPAEDPTYTCLLGAKEFVGWTTQEIDGVGVPANLYTDEFPVVTEAITYYAVFAGRSAEASTTISTLLVTEKLGNYASGSMKDDQENVWKYYAGGLQDGETYYIALRNNNDEISYIESPKFSGTVQSIVAHVKNGSSKVRTVYLRSSAIEKPAEGDFGATSIPASNNSEVNLDFTSSFDKFYIQVSDGLQFHKIVVTSGIAIGDYVDYVTSCKAFEVSIEVVDQLVFDPINMNTKEEKNLAITTLNYNGALTFSITGTDASHFTYGTFTDGQLPITYQPTEAGEHTATLTITAGEKTATVTLIGKSIDYVSGIWELVTDAATLTIGDKVVVVAKEKNFALSTTQKENNRGQAAVTKNNDNTISFKGDVQILTLKKGFVNNTFALYTSDGYLYAASNSSNHLKTLATIVPKSSWSITIQNDITTIAAQENSHNIMQYNFSSKLFACYENSNLQDPICLYRKKNIKVDETSDNTSIPNQSDVTVDNAELTVTTEAEYDNMYIGGNGTVKVATEVTVNNLYISTTMGATTSGQLNTAPENLIVTGDVFIDITLGKNSEDKIGDPNQWHAFTVPFPVDAMNGVYDINDKKLTNEVNYAIMDYHGDLRANGQYGWKKYRGILVPGTFYLMTVDGARPTYRFKKVEDAAIVAPATKAITAFTGSGDATKDKGWNGVGNPTLMHGKVAYNALVLNPATYTYEAYEAEEVAFTVGTPFFIQAAEDGSMTMTSEPSASLAPARRAAAAVENIKVMLGNSDYTDRLYVSASEDATTEYEIGKDLGKMAMTSMPSVVQISALAYDTRLCMIDAPMANNEALVSLNLYAPANGEYTLSIEAQDNEKVYLLHEGTFVWDLSMSEYPITLNKGDNAGYSILVHRADAPTSVETIDGTNNQTEKLIHNGNLYILHNGKVFDAVGTMLK